MTLGVVERIKRSPEILMSILLLLIIFLVGTVGIAGFGGAPTIKAVFLIASFLGIASVGQTIVMILGGIDLSIPFVVGAANVAVAKFYGDGMPFPMAVLVVGGLAAVLGSINALISVRSNVHPLIVTLGTGTAALGLVTFWTNGLPSGGAPAWLGQFVAIGAGIGPVPVPPIILLWAAIVVFVVVLLRGSVFGRHLYALGSSPRAAELALVRKLPVWLGAFSLSGVFAAISGVLLLGFTGTAFADVGQSYLFLSVGAVVLGGTVVTGGKGGYVGTVVGALTITLLTAVFTGFGLNSSLQQVVLGAFFLLVVALYGRDAHVRTRV